MDRKGAPASGQERMIEAYTTGTALRAWTYMGSHAQEREGVQGYVFRVWAPHALEVSVVGDFNGWEHGLHPMTALGGGLWEGFVPGHPLHAVVVDESRFPPPARELTLAERFERAVYLMDKSSILAVYSDSRRVDRKERAHGGEI